MTDEMPPGSLDGLANRFGEAPKDSQNRDSSQQPQRTTPVCTYEHMGDVEETAGIDAIWTGGKFTFCASFERLRNAGYHRHLSAAEALSLLCDGASGKLTNKSLPAITNKFLPVYQNMTIGNPGEWLNHAFARDGNTLRIYNVNSATDTTPNIIWAPSVLGGGTYRGASVLDKGVKSLVDNFECDVIGLPSCKPIALNEFPKEFVRFLWGREFLDIPYELRQHQLNVYLPKKGMIWPLARGSERLGELYSLIACPLKSLAEWDVGQEAASRGMREHP